MLLAGELIFKIAALTKRFAVFAISGAHDDYDECDEVLG